ncbi:MAG: amino acid adenylation domain-containing protein [Candidatus Rickettsia vulgarisii]
MKKLNFIVIGNNDIASLCTVEILSAGHAINVINNDKLDSDPMVIYVLCHKNIEKLDGINLVFNEHAFDTSNFDIQNTESKTHIYYWYISFNKDGFFYPISTNVDNDLTIEEKIRESFIEILSNLSRQTLNEDYLIKNSSIIISPTIDQDSIPKNLWEAFVNTVQKYPHNTALKYGDTSVNYNQLYYSASTTADKIKAKYNPTYPYIALYFKKNINMIIAILATLKENFSYIPLDPKNPIERNKLIIDDSKVNLILCDSELVEEVKLLSSNIKIFCVNWQDYNISSFIEYTPHNNSNKIAYIIYTSGSTEKPKGVMCTHCGAINMILWTINTYPITCKDSIIQLAPYAFDISIWEIFAALISGAKLILAQDDEYSDPHYIANTISKHQVSIAHMIPTILDLFIDELENTPCLTLKHVVSGGEELRPDTVQRFFNKLPNCNLYHGYGPTECAITSIHYKAIANLNYDFIPIGFPIQNINLYVVNDKQHLTLKGVVGKLYIGGKGVALGYINNQNENENHFFKSCSAVDKVIYRTGDLVKILSDNTVKYIGRIIGRIDNQVKISGKRVEVEEIERVIAQQFNIKAVSIQTINDNSHGKKNIILVAYCVFRKVVDYKIELTKVKKKLSLILPQYMIPSYFIHLDNLPKTINGKIDKDALIKLYFDHDIPLLINKNIPSDISSITEKKVFQFAVNELKLQVNNLNDNLLSLGINSIGIIYLINFIEKTFTVRVAPLDIFQFTSIKNISEEIERRKINYNKFIGYSIPFAYVITNNYKLRHGVIAVYLEKSIAFFVSIIAIMKSGNTYLIIDPEMPDSRVNYILSDSNANCIIINNKLPSIASNKISIINYTDLMHKINSYKAPITLCNDCYILYALGSTGQPKGVQVLHKNLINTLHFFVNKFRTHNPCQLLSLTSQSFDIFQLEIFLPLLSGDTCYFSSKPFSLFVNNIKKLITSINPDFIQASPSAWKLIIQQCAKLRFNSIALVGGENFDNNLLSSLQEHFKEVYNFYGPTETTIWSTYSNLTNSSGPLRCTYRQHYNSIS